MLKPGTCLAVAFFMFGNSRMRIYKNLKRVIFMAASKESIKEIMEPKKPNVALFVDGPNLIRKEFDIDLDKFRTMVESYGKIQIAKVFLNQFASEKLIEAITNQGFEVIMGLGGERDVETSDVDVYMATEAMEAIRNENIDVIIIATRDADFLPVVQKAKKYNKYTVVVGAEPGLSTALRNAADKIEIVQEMSRH